MSKRLNKLGFTLTGTAIVVWLFSICGYELTTFRYSVPLHDKNA